MKIGTIVKSKAYGYLVVVGDEHQVIGNRIVTMAVDRFGVKHPLDGTEIVVAPPKKKMPKGKTPNQVMKELYGPKPGEDYPTHQEMRDTVNKLVVAAFNELTGEFATIDFASRIAADFARNEAKKAVENVKQLELGRDVPTFEQCYQLAEKVAKNLIGKIERQEIQIETGESIKTKLELLTGNLRLDASAIKNLPKPIINQMMPGKGGFGGQSFTAQVRASEDDQVPGFLEDKLVAGENVTLTVSGTGRERTITIAASATGTSQVSDEAYNATTWNGVTDVAPSKNAVRDKIEAMLAAGGITRTVVLTSGSAAMAASANTDYMYFVTGAHTMSLPAAAGNTNRYVVKNNHSAAITVDTAGAETVEGAASITIQPGGSESFMSDGSNWYVTD